MVGGDDFQVEIVGPGNTTPKPNIVDNNDGCHISLPHVLKGLDAWTPLQHNNTYIPPPDISPLHSHRANCFSMKKLLCAGCCKAKPVMSRQYSLAVLAQDVHGALGDGEGRGLFDYWVAGGLHRGWLCKGMCGTARPIGRLTLLLCRRGARQGGGRHSCHLHCDSMRPVRFSSWLLLVPSIVEWWSVVIRYNMQPMRFPP